MVKLLSFFRLFFFLYILVIAYKFSSGASAQTYTLPDSFIEAPLIYPYETFLKGITKVLPVGNIFSRYSSLELSLVNSNIIKPKQWLKDKIFDELGEIAETEQILRGKDSPFSDPIFEQFKNMPIFIEDTLAQLTYDPLVFCKEVRKGYNKSGIHFELNCTFPFGFFNKYLILRLQYINNLWYFEKITTFNYTRLLDLLSISETLEIK